MPNDPNSATAATRRADCNCDGLPPFAAAHGVGGMSIISITTITELLAHPEETRLGAGKRVGHHNVNGPDFSAVAGRGLPVRSRQRVGELHSVVVQLRTCEMKADGVAIALDSVNGGWGYQNRHDVAVDKLLLFRAGTPERADLAINSQGVERIANRVRPVLLIRRRTGIDMERHRGQCKRIPRK